MLKDGKLLTFANAARKLSRVWLENAEYDNVSLRIEEYILLGGVYGSIENRVVVHQSKKGGKLRYVLGRIFVPMDVLVVRYPSLERHGWLMPAYQVRRWFGILFRGRLKSSVQELKTSGNISKDKSEAKRC